MSRETYMFSQVPTASIPRSVFNRSHTHKTTFDAGYLVPVFVDEVLPGDTFKMNASMFARLSTPIVPIMDNMYLDVFFFFVPNRLLWANWQKFCGEQANPGDSTSFSVPQLTGGAWTQGTVGDYFGVPVGVTMGIANLQVNALPFRAYNLIYNEWFRDENLILSAIKNTGDGPDSYTDYLLRRRGKRHDYFTSCLPWPQKGAGVMLPLGTTAPLIPVTNVAGVGVPLLNFGTGNTAGQAIRAAALGVGQNIQAQGNTLTALQDARWPTAAQQANASGLVADLTNATAATINSLRQAFQIQKLLERDARGGTRYIEILRSHFGVVSPDARVQRPEYLGGGSVPIMINPVAQTSATGVTGGGTPIGKLAGYGVAAGRGIGFSKSFVEHGYIIGIVCARAENSYQQGLHRLFSRYTRYDFYWPAFANLGEQAVLNKELYAIGDNGTQDNAVFGYQERWAEYRYFPSKITGKFRSTDATPLDFWHLAQKFTALPVLNQTFIEENPPVSRIVAVSTEPQFIFDSSFSLSCTRPMPTYSVPGMIDHF